MENLVQFFSGAICLGYAIAGLFFVKFWRRSHDPLFAAFALAFATLVALRIVLSGVPPESELRGFLYLGRLLAYLLILWAIIHKNRGTSKQTGQRA